MNPWLQLFADVSLVRVVVGVAFQVAGVVGLVWLIGRTIARRNAAVRHTLWRAALACTLLSPLLAWQVDRSGVALFAVEGESSDTRRPTLGKEAALRLASNLPPVVSIPANTRPASVASAAPTVQSDVEASMSGTTALSREGYPAAIERTEGPATSAAQVAETLTNSSSEFSDSLNRRADIAAASRVMVFVDVLWGVGVVVLLARFVQDLRAVRRLYLSSKPADLDDETARRLRGSIDLPSFPPLRFTTSVQGPIAVGVFRPTVIVSRSLFESLEAQQRADVLIHEFTHVIQHDYLVGLLQRVANALFWLHPFVYLMSRNLRRSREEVCDNAVLRSQLPAAYARTLLELSERLRLHTPASSPAVGMFDGKRWLEHRVNELLQPGRNVTVRMSRRAVGALSASIAVFAISLATLVGAEKPGLPSSRPTSMPTGSTEAAVSGIANPSATQPQVAFSGTGPDATTGSSRASGRLFTPVEAADVAKLQQLTLAVQRAELDVREADLKVKSDRQQTEAALKAGDSRLAPGTPVTSTMIELDEVRLQRANIALAETRNAMEQFTNRAPVVVWWIDSGMNLETIAQYSAWPEGAALKAIVAASVPSLAEVQGHKKWVVVVSREVSDGVETVYSGLTDAVANEAGNGPMLRAGDNVAFREDAVTVEQPHGSLFGAEVIDEPDWKGVTEGKPVTAREALRRANRKNIQDKLKVVVRSCPPGLGRYRISKKEPSGTEIWSSTVGEILHGRDGDRLLRPTDHLTLQSESVEE